MNYGVMEKMVPSMSNGNIKKEKLGIIHSFRITGKMKVAYDQLPEEFISIMSAELRKTFAKVLHMAEFKSEKYGLITDHTNFFD